MGYESGRDHPLHDEARGQGNYICIEAGDDCPGHATPSGRCTLTMDEKPKESPSGIHHIFTEDPKPFDDHSEVY